MIEFIQTTITPRRLYDEFETELLRRVGLITQEVKTVLRSRYHLNFPPLRDLLSFPEVRNMIDPDQSDTFGREELDELLSSMDDLLSVWRTDRIQRLEECLRSERDDLPDDSVAILDLAIGNVAHCDRSDCERVFVNLWPSSSTHRCNTITLLAHYIGQLHPKTCHEKSRDLWYDTVVDIHLHCSPWETDSIHPFVQEIATIVKLCGKDPLQVTPEEMDKLDLRFFCDQEYKETGIRTILKWREAVSSLMFSNFIVIFIPYRLFITSLSPRVSAISIQCGLLTPLTTGILRPTTTTILSKIHQHYREIGRFFLLRIPRRL